ncbi:hypothetical protein CL622_06735 [archaeon]|nr:hypothetical protein [archaeon]
MRRGQVSIELILLVSLAMILLIGFITIEFIYTRDVVSARKTFSAEDIALKVKTELSLAGRVRPEYERVFSLPPDIAGEEYSLQFGAREIAVQTNILGQPSTSAKLLPIEISNTPLDIDITPQNRFIKINKDINGDITVSVQSSL